MTGHPLPANLEAEQALLGALLHDNRAFEAAAAIVRADQFSEPVHREIFAAIGRLLDAGKKADFVMVAAELPDFQVGDMNKRQYLARLFADATTVINAADYARVIRDTAVRRDLVVLGEEMAGLAAAPAIGMTSPEDMLAYAETALTEIREAHRLADATVSSAAAWDAHDQKRFGGAVTSGWPWPIPQIGWCLDGDVEPGNLYGLLGASGDGKSSLTLQMLVHFAGIGLPSLFLSGEQTDAQCRDQIYQQHTKVSAKNIKRNTVTDSEYAEVRKVKDWLRNLPFEIQAWPEEPVSGIARRVRAFVRRNGPCFFALDHASMIVPDEKRDLFAEQVRRAYAGVKRICVETNSVGLVLMHRNSAFLERRRMRPVRADVYGGEAALRALDACFAVFRPAKWLNERASVEDSEKIRNSMVEEAAKYRQFDSLTERAELYSLKTRFGEEGLHQTLANGRALIFEGARTRFTSEVVERRAMQGELLP